MNPSHAAVIVAVPTATALTRPALDTVATVSSEDVQVIVPVAPEGVSVAVSCCVSPPAIESVAVVGATVIPVTTIGASLMVSGV